MPYKFKISEAQKTVVDGAFTGIDITVQCIKLDDNDNFVRKSRVTVNLSDFDGEPTKPEIISALRSKLTTEDEDGQTPISRMKAEAERTRTVTQTENVDIDGELTI